MTMTGRGWLLAVLLACMAVAASGLKVVQLAAGDAQGFANAIAAFGTSGEDTTIKLPYGRVLSLLNATVVSATGPKPFSTGVLTIEPGEGDGTAPTVLDGGMRFGFISVDGAPTFSAGAKLHLINFILVNMCDTNVPLDLRNGLFFATAALSGLFRRNVITQTDLYINITSIFRHADFTALMWAQAMLRVPPTFNKLYDLARPLLVEQTSSPQSIRMLNSFSATGSFLVTTSQGENVTLRSVLDPYDPVLVALRNEKRLMEPRYCTGFFPPAPLYVDTTMPMWIPADTMEWLGAVSEAVKRANVATTKYAAPGVVMLAGKAVPLGAFSTVEVAPLLQGPLVLTGPNNDLEGVVTDSVLDLSGGERPVIRVAARGLLFVQLMTLKGLAVRPLPQSASSASGTTATQPLSVFPLSAFPHANSSATIEMFNVILVLPTADYLALLTLVLSGDTANSIARCVTAATRAHATALKTGISSLSLQPATPQPLTSEDLYPYTSFALSRFTGWGINATGLVLQPSDPYSVLLNCRPTTVTAAAEAEQSCSSGLSAQQVGIIAGCSVAGLMLLQAVLMGVAVLVWRRNRRLSPPGATAHVSSIEKGDSTKPPGGVSNQEQPRQEGSPRQAPARQPPFMGLESGAEELPDAEDARGIFVSFRKPTVGEEGRLRQCLLLQVVSAAEVAAGMKRGAPGPVTATSATLSALKQVGSSSAMLNKPGQTPGSKAQANLNKKDVAVKAEMAVVLRKEPPNPAAANPAPGLVSRPVTGDKDADSKAMQSKSDVSAGAYNRQASSVSTATTNDPRAAINQMVNEMAVEKETVVVHEVLGAGSWGTVYKGTWRGLDVALKTLVFEVEEVSGQKPRAGVARQQQAITEAAVAASVDHKNVVRTYHYDIKEVHSKEHSAGGPNGLQIDMLENEGGYKEFKLFLVQELCSMPLSGAIAENVFHCHKTGKLLEPSVMLLMLLDIAEGLAYLHSRNIIHGDLKPANVLLKMAEDHTGVVGKLADFGLSARMTGGATHVSNHRGGTPFYVAPEVVHEYRTSTASDVFAFGVLMWQLYSGLLPYQCGRKGEFSWNPVFPRFQRPNIPPTKFASLTHRCLLRDPRQRPTAAQLIAHLEENCMSGSGSRPGGGG